MGKMPPPFVIRLKAALRLLPELSEGCDIQGMCFARLLAFSLGQGSRWSFGPFPVTHFGYNHGGEAIRRLHLKESESSQKRSQQPLSVGGGGPSSLPCCSGSAGGQRERERERERERNTKHKPQKRPRESERGRENLRESQPF